MNNKILNLYILIIFTCTTQYAQDNLILQGTIQDSIGNPIQGASITIKEIKEQNILAFDISQADGFYEIYMNIDLDTFLVKVDHISYASQNKIVPGDTRILDWVLTAEAYNLPEVVFEKPRVVRRGDTLVFDVQSLQQEGDENIETIIARIPGITIEESGRILYQDLPISKFYIEGLDLLEGRYSIASRGLRPSVIRDIEILEEHQHIRALDSIIRPPNAAINLRLKSSVAWTGDGNAGAGFSPELYRVESRLFGFQKNQQFNFLGSLTNAGRLNATMITDHFSDFSFEANLLSPQSILPPIQLQPSQLDYKQHLAGFNILRKVGKNQELKWQGYLDGNRQTLEGLNERIFRGDIEKVTFTESLLSKNTNRLLNSKLIYELNSSNIYLKFTGIGDINDDHTVTDNTINNVESSEDYLEDQSTITGNISMLIRKGKQAYHLQSKNKYRDENVNLEYQPLFLPAFQTFSDIISPALQFFRRKNFTSETYTTHYYRKNKLSISTDVGLKYKSENITSDLKDEDPDGTFTSVGPAFLNDMSQKTIAPYLKQYWTWDNTKDRWKLDLIFSRNSIDITDNLINQEINNTLWIINPSIEYLRRFTAESVLTFALSYNRTYDENMHYYNNFVVRSNRFVDQSPFFLNRRTNYEISTRYQGTDNFTGTNYNSYLALGRNQFDIITNTSFDSIGLVSNQTRVSNTQKYLRWTNNFQFKSFSSLNLKLHTYYSISRRPRILNNELTNINSQLIWLEPGISNVSDLGAISFTPRINIYLNSLSENAIWQYLFTIGYYTKFPENLGDLKFNIVHNITSTPGNRVANSLMNVTYGNQVKKWSIEWNIELYNLLNTRRYVTFRQGIFDEELQQIFIRPRQIIFSISKKI